MPLMISSSPPASPGRPEFVTLIAIYQFATAAVLLLMSCMLAAVGVPALFFLVREPGFIAVSMTWIMVMALALGFATASVVVGWGLLRMREWARLGAIVLAAFALIGFPIWTIAAVLILVYLTSDDARTAFKLNEPGPETDAGPEPTAPPADPIYKAEPVRDTRADPRTETRDVYPPKANSGTNGAPPDRQLSEETREVESPIAMPPGEPIEPDQTTDLVPADTEETSLQDPADFDLPDEPESEVTKRIDPEELWTAWDIPRPEETPTAEVPGYDDTAPQDRPEPEKEMSDEDRPDPERPRSFDHPHDASGAIAPDDSTNDVVGDQSVAEDDPEKTDPSDDRRSSSS